MSKHNLFKAAALAGMMASTAQAGTSVKKEKLANPAAAPTAVKGECHGINACKGKGECGGLGYGCAGNNACKGQGWLGMTKEECDAKKGTFKPDSHG